MIPNLRLKSTSQICTICQENFVVGMAVHICRRNHKKTSMQTHHASRVREAVAEGEQKLYGLPAGP